jgi:hypothetical protein
MEKTLTKPSQRQCEDTAPTLDSLVSEWIAKLAINAGASLDAKTQAIYKAVWIDGLGDLSPDVLRAAFQKTLRECVYWPVKVADIRKYVSGAESNAVNVAAEKSWERVQQAARAAGIWRDFPTTEALHVWAKKQFIESFIAWGEAECDKFLLPDGEIKNLLIEFSETKALPAPQVRFDDLHKQGLRYAEECKVLSAWSDAADALPEFDVETRAEIETELVSYGKRFDAVLAKRQASQ